MRALRWAVDGIHSQQERHHQDLRERLRSSQTPLPPELFEQIVHLNNLHLRDIMRDHPAFTVWERYHSYQLSLRVFERSGRDFLAAIGRFETHADNSSAILDRANKDQLEDIEDAIQKELFAVTNAALSLVDHARRLQDEVAIPSFQVMRQECFGNDGLHEFIHGLRVILFHLQAVEAGWNITHEFGKDKTASFMLDRKDLQLALETFDKSFSAEKKEIIRTYLAAGPLKLDLKVVFGEYRGRAARFNAWFGEQLGANSLVGLRDYERCITENTKRSARQYWHLMLTSWLNAKKPPNPYNHLTRFLTPEQIAEVYALPAQSDEQIDLAIKYGDHDGLCDDSLRSQIHRLFKLGTPNTATDPKAI